MNSTPGDHDLRRAMLAAERRDFSHAIDLLGRVLAREPRNASLWFNRAALLQQAGRAADAIIDYDKALALNALDPEAWFNRGVACEAAERLEAAAQSYDRVLALQPRHVGARNNRGIVLARLGWHADALANFEVALKLNPRDAKALYNAANALRELNRAREALDAYDRALALDPAHVNTLNNRALCLLDLERPEEALAAIDKALVLGETAQGRGNRGLILLALDRPEEAGGEIDAALRRGGDIAGLESLKGMARLMQGRFAEGWVHYEDRWNTPLAGKRPDVGAPLWLGEEQIAGKSVLLHAEQGLGDTLQFMRYAPLLAEWDARVILRVQPPLKALLAEGMPVEVIGFDDPAPAPDFCTPLMSAPLAMRSRLTDIPAKLPYLAADRGRMRAWRDRLGERGPKIGLFWRSTSGSSAFHTRRSVALGALAPALPAHAQLISLMIDVEDGEPEILEQCAIRSFGEELKDFREQAALTACCDLVIAIDSMMAHLAGALGRPLWIPLPTGADWRWMTGRDDSPWYPGARLFRQQSPGDWRSPLARIGAELRRFAAAFQT